MTCSSNPLVDFYQSPRDLVSSASSEEPLVGRTGRKLSETAWLADKFATTVDGAYGLVDDLRLERYPAASSDHPTAMLSEEAVRRIYYSVRPMLSDPLRRMLQRLYFSDRMEARFPAWPVDTTVEEVLGTLLEHAIRTQGLDQIPFIWFWPDGARGALMVTHDVETSSGLDFVRGLMDVDEDFGVKTAFQLVPEKRYAATNALLDEIRGRGHEVNVHDLNHSGNLFRDRKDFRQKAVRINEHVRRFKASGFRSGCMYRNARWYEWLNISYDMSIPNVAHLEPQRGGCCTVFPFFIGNVLELPLTTVQDYALFHILGEHSIGLWKRQVEIILTRHGLASFIAHPDYLQTTEALSTYKALLEYLSDLRDHEGVWMARPAEIDRWWRDRRRMKLVRSDGVWCVEGPGHERARVAFARLENGRLVYSLAERPEPCLSDGAAMSTVQPRERSRG